MFWQFFIWLIPTLSAVELIYLLYLAWASSRVPKLALDDVVHFLYPVDTSLLAGLLDPAADFELRWKLSPLRLCEEQRRRMLVYRELLRRMSHNSAVLAEFDNSVRAHDALVVGPGSKLQEAALNVRIYCTFARVRLRMWLWLPLSVFRIIPVPRIACLRVAAQLDGLKAYFELREAAKEAFAKLQPAELEALSHNL
ncbi:MAG: hypothetical protein ABR874_07885 [Candidatus Sulfotelmatobacter sp.]|jgi:hypothetical protein